MKDDLSRTGFFLEDDYRSATILSLHPSILHRANEVIPSDRLFAFGDGEWKHGAEDGSRVLRYHNVGLRFAVFDRRDVFGGLGRAGRSGFVQAWRLSLASRLDLDFRLLKLRLLGVVS